MLPFPLTVPKPNTSSDPSMLLLSMMVDLSRIHYTFGWSFHCMTKKVYRKEGQTIYHNVIVTIINQRSD
jgi:hypothetical protein